MYGVFDNPSRNCLQLLNIYSQQDVYLAYYGCELSLTNKSICTPFVPSLYLPSISLGDVQDKQRHTSQV